MTSSLRRNILANAIGQAATGLLGVVFIPIYVRYIGIENYGIVGLFAMLAAAFSVLDLGLSAALGREIARRGAGTGQDVRSLVRTIEWCYLPIAPLIFLSSWLLAGLLARDWLQTVSVAPEEAAFGLVLLGASAALQWPSSLYAAGLNGMQRQVLLNSIRVLHATVAAVGCVAALAICPTFETYLWWQVLMSALFSVVMAALFYRGLPRGHRSPARFRKEILVDLKGFVFGMSTITVLSLLLTQADRFVLSKVLPLDRFGEYALASALASIVYRFVQPISLAAGPRYTQLVQAGAGVELLRQYHLTNQAMAVVLFPISFVGALFSQDIIYLWSASESLAQRVSPIFSVLVVSAALHGMATLPYLLQVAHGWTSLSLRLNVAAVTVVVPLFWWLGTNFGAEGAAYGWLVLTVYYVFIGVPLMHTRLLPRELPRWIRQDLLWVAGASAIWSSLMRWFVDVVPGGLWGWLVLFVIGGTTLAVAVLSAPMVRQELIRLGRGACLSSEEVD